jgi:histidinol dehydrogenase
MVLFMQFHKYPPTDTWEQLLARPALSLETAENVVKPILQAVKVEGDAAVRRFTEQFDGLTISHLQVSEDDIQEAGMLLDKSLREAISVAYHNIRRFHLTQQTPVEKIQTMPGVSCWRRSAAIQKVGLYIPGGTAPLFSTVLMLGIPAEIAGCEEVILCSPAGKDGKIHPAVLYTAQLVGIHKIFCIGGSQAIAAMAFGTESVPKVYKIFGPGNQYVTAAKQLITREGVAIDMPAGPSEVAVYADKTANPAFVAADLLSQAEHGADSQVILVSEDENLLRQVEVAVDEQLTTLPRRNLAEKALQNSRLILVRNQAQAIALLNAYAAEHLILAIENPELVAEQIVNAGSVFLGHYSPESVGDYASGTNHTLPTNGYARAYSGVSVDSFVKKITYQQLTPEGLQAIGGAVETMAEAEGLEAHARAVKIRLERLMSDF